MKFYKFVLLKAYFDKGYGVTSYFKFAIAIFGVSSLNPKLTLSIFFVYGLLCFLIGWIWYKYGFAESEAEVSNKVNPFVQEMRAASSAISYSANRKV